MNRNKKKQNKYFEKQLERIGFTSNDVDDLKKSNLKELRRIGRYEISNEQNAEYFNKKKRKKENKKKNKKEKKNKEFDEIRRKLLQEKNKKEAFLDSGKNIVDHINKDPKHIKEVLNKNIEKKYEVTNVDALVDKGFDFIISHDGVYYESEYFLNKEMQDSHKIEEIVPINKLPVHIRKSNLRNIKPKNPKKFSEKCDYIDVFRLFTKYSRFVFFIHKGVLGNDKDFLFLNNEECIPNITINDIPKKIEQLNQQRLQFKIYDKIEGCIIISNDEQGKLLALRDKERVFITPYGILQKSKDTTTMQNKIRDKIYNAIIESRNNVYVNKINNIKNEIVRFMIDFIRREDMERMVLTRMLTSLPKTNLVYAMRIFNQSVLDELNYSIYMQTLTDNGYLVDQLYVDSTNNVK
jgi:hypothetical protein